MMKRKQLTVLAANTSCEFSHILAKNIWWLLSIEMDSAWVYCQNIAKKNTDSTCSIVWGKIFEFGTSRRVVNELMKQHELFERFLWTFWCKCLMCSFKCSFYRSHVAISCEATRSQHDVNELWTTVTWQAFYQTDSSVCLPRQVSWCWSFHYTDIHPSESDTQVHTCLTMFVCARVHQCLRCCHAAKQCASSPVCFSTNVADVNAGSKCRAWSWQPKNGTLELTWGDV